MIYKCKYCSSIIALGKECKGCDNKQFENYEEYNNNNMENNNKYIINTYTSGIYSP